MKKIAFMLDDRVFVEDNATWDDIEMAILDKVSAMVRAIKEGVDFDLLISTDSPESISPRCPHCGGKVVPSGLGQYDLMCEECDEDFFLYECLMK